MQTTTTRPISAADLVIPDDPTVLSYLLSGIVQIELPRRQALLEAETTVYRLEGLISSSTASSCCSASGCGCSRRTPACWAAPAEAERRAAPPTR